MLTIKAVLDYHSGCPVCETKNHVLANCPVARKVILQQGLNEQHPPHNIGQRDVGHSRSRPPTYVNNNNWGNPRRAGYHDGRGQWPIYPRGYSIPVNNNSQRNVSGMRGNHFYHQPNRYSNTRAIEPNRSASAQPFSPRAQHNPPYYDRAANFNNNSREERSVGQGHQQLSCGPRVNDANDTREAVNLRYVTVSVDGLRVRALLDTGASVSLCTERICKNIDKSNRGELKGVGGSTMSLGTAFEQVGVGAVNFKAKFYVVNPDVIAPYDMFLGINILAQAGWQLNLYEGYLLIDNNKVQVKRAGPNDFINAINHYELDQTTKDDNKTDDGPSPYYQSDDEDIYYDEELAAFENEYSSESSAEEEQREVVVIRDFRRVTTGNGDREVDEAVPQQSEVEEENGTVSESPHSNGLPIKEEDQSVDLATEGDGVAEQGESSKSNRCHFLKGKNQLKTKPRALLPTAIVYITHPNGSRGGEVRALIDPGSEVNIISQHVVDMLNLPTRQSNASISSLGGNNVGPCRETKMLVQAGTDATVAWMVLAYVQPELTGVLPEEPVDVDSIAGFPDNFTLADDQLDVPQQVDLILGVRMYATIVKEGFRKVNNGNLLLQNSELGWLVMGRVPGSDITADTETPAAMVQHID